MQLFQAKFLRLQLQLVRQAILQHVLILLRSFHDYIEELPENMEPEYDPFLLELL